MSRLALMIPLRIKNRSRMSHVLICLNLHKFMYVFVARPSKLDRYILSLFTVTLSEQCQ